MNRVEIVKEFICNGEKGINPIVVYRLGNTKMGYFPSQKELEDFRKLLEKQNSGDAIITHHGMNVELVYIPNWLIRLDNFIRKIFVWTRLKGN